MQTTNSTNCPECGKVIDLIPSPTKPGRLVALCDCKGRAREVVETDDPNFVPFKQYVEPEESPSEKKAVKPWNKPRRLNN